MAKRKLNKTSSDFQPPASSSSEPVPKSKLQIALAILLFFAVVAIFLPCLGNGFLSAYGDDPLYVTENYHVTSGLSWENISWAFTSMERSNWHPLTWISHMLDCQIYGLKPWGHHLTNVLFHAINAVLLFFLLRQMTGAIWRSLVVAVLFAVHPLRAESVAWVAERKDVLSTFFWMLTIWAYVRYAEKKAGGQVRKGEGGNSLDADDDFLGPLCEK